MRDQLAGVVTGPAARMARLGRALRGGWGWRLVLGAAVTLAGAGLLRLAAGVGEFRQGLLLNLGSSVVLFALLALLNEVLVRRTAERLLRAPFDVAAGQLKAQLDEYAPVALPGPVPTAIRVSAAVQEALTRIHTCGLRALQLDGDVSRLAGPSGWTRRSAAGVTWTIRWEPARSELRHRVEVDRALLPADTRTCWRHEHPYGTDQLADFVAAVGPYAQAVSEILAGRHPGDAELRLERRLNRRG